MKRMKKVLSVILIAVMLLTAAPLSGFVGIDFPEIDLGAVFTPKAEAETEGASDTCGENLTWTLDDDGTLTISGTGAMFDYSESNAAPWHEHCYNIKAIVIEEGVTSIGAFAFYLCGGGNSISVSLPESLTTIGEGAFYGCSPASIRIPAAVKVLANMAFAGCRVAAYSVDESNTSYSCDDNGVLFNKGKTVLIQYPIAGEREVYIVPDKVTKIADGAFAESWNLSGVLMQDGVTHIGANAFYGCGGLQEVVLPDSLKEIGEEAFYSCSSLASIFIPAGVTTIGPAAFADCSALVKIEVDESNAKYSSDKDDILFNKSKSHLIQYPIGLEKTSYTVPFGVTSIGDAAFAGAQNLTSIEISASIGSIGSEAFRYCANLASIVLPDGLTEIGEEAFLQCESLVSIEIPSGVTSIGNFTFCLCTSLESVTLPQGLTSIGAGAFYECLSLADIVLPNSLTSIGQEAFHYCRSLESVFIPAYVTDLGYAVFAECSSLKKFEVDAANATYRSDNDGVLFSKDKTKLIQYPIGNKRTRYTVPDGVTSIGDVAFLMCTNLADIVLPDSLISIGTAAFGATDIASIIIPDGVTTIGVQAFKYCFYLESITIPASVTEIKEYAFDGCKSLYAVYYNGHENTWDKIEVGVGNSVLNYASIHFGKISSDSLTWELTDDGTLIISGTGPMTDYTNIARAPWYGQTAKIKRIVIEDGVTSIGDYAFFGCAGFTSIEIADSVTKIGECAFYQCLSLASVSLPANLETIGESAFFNCKQLPAINIPANLTSIGDDAFLDCKSIASFDVDEQNALYCDIDGVLFNSDATELICYPAGKADTQYRIPVGVQAIADYAFINCDGPESITLPDSLQSIGKFAFQNCTNLRSLHIPVNVTAIGNGAFYNTVKMLSITVDSDNAKFTAAGNALYNKDQTELIYYAAADGKISFTLPVSVIKIHDFAFCSATALRSITIDKLLTYVGKSAFANCSDLYVVYYNGTKAQWDLIDFESFNSPLLDAEKHFIEAPSVTYKGLTAYIDDAYFANDSIDYNHELAKFCALFTVIGYNENYQKPEDIKDCLKNCGFTVDKAIIVNDASQEQVNHFIAHKEIYVNGEVQTLIFAGFIGSHLKQWLSNFDPGTGETHKGFTNAKNYVYEHLEKYINDLGIEKNKTKILLTGHSRGAATSNLVARELIANGKYASPDSIYTYAFATPNSTCLPERKNAEYKRIFNIVNPEDLVTKMIPTAWGGEVGYGRYGITYTLPSETNDAAYSNLLQNMQVVFEDMMGEKYHPFPGGEEETYLVVNDLTKVVKSLDEFYETKFYWHPDAVDKPGTIISVQQFMTQTVASYKAYDGTDKQDEAVKKIKGTHFGTLSDDILRSLAAYFVLYQGLDGVPVIGWFYHPYFDNAHSAATYCAYTFTMSEKQMLEGKERKAYNGTVNCPVDVEIYNKANGELVGRIVNNAVDEEIAAKENAVVMSVDGDSKSFWLPSNGDYEVKLIGNDDGTMDYTISEIDSDIGEVKRANFFDVEITDGFTMTADMSSEDFVIEETELVLEDGSTLLPSEIMGEGEITTYSIDITATEGGTAGSSRTVNSGDYVSLVATPDEGWTFVGWYENDELISAEATLAFVAKSNRNLTAKFEQAESEFTLGDVNEDGQITSADARAALRAAVGLDALTEQQTLAADIDKNGTITSSDARSILRCAVGLETLG